MLVSYSFNGQFKDVNDPLSSPLEYYNNIIVFPSVVSKVETLCKNSFAYAMEFVRNLKFEMNANYLRSIKDFMVIKRQCELKLKGNTFVIELAKFEFKKTDLQSGCQEYVGPPHS